MDTLQTYLEDSIEQNSITGITHYEQQSSIRRLALCTSMYVCTREYTSAI